MGAPLSPALRRGALALVAGLAACATGPSPEVAPPAGAGYRLVPPASPEAEAREASRVREIERIPPDVFAAGEFRARDGTELRYRLLPPPDPVPGRRYPLVVLFHGSGESGTDNRKQVDRFALAWARPEIRRRFPAYVLAPQMPGRSANYTGPPGTPGRSSFPEPPLHAALELADSLLAALPVDSARVYAVGFSMGGSSVWNALWMRPGMFAAAIPVAGVPNRARAAESARTPLWVIHGNDDDANPIEPDRETYAVLRDLGAPVTFWEYQGGVHRVPPELLAGDAFPRWLFAHRRDARR